MYQRYKLISNNIDTLQTSINALDNNADICKNKMKTTCDELIKRIQQFKEEMYYTHFFVACLAARFRFLRVIR